MDGRRHAGLPLASAGITRLAGHTCRAGGLVIHHERNRPHRGLGRPDQMTTGAPPSVSDPQPARIRRPPSPVQRQHQVR